MERLTHTSRSINSWVEGVVAVSAMAMALIVVLQVFCRYLLNSSLFWSEEVARYLLVWLSFLGATVAYFRHIHPGIDILTARMSRRLRRYCRILVFLTSLCFFAVMVYHGAAFAWFIRAQTSPALVIPKWIIFAVIPVSGLIFLLHCLSFLTTELKESGNDN